MRCIIVLLRLTERYGHWSVVLDLALKVRRRDVVACDCVCRPLCLVACSMNCVYWRTLTSSGKEKTPYLDAGPRPGSMLPGGADRDDTKNTDVGGFLYLHNWHPYHHKEMSSVLIYREETCVDRGRG